MPESAATKNTPPSTTSADEQGEGTKPTFQHAPISPSTATTNSNPVPNAESSTSPSPPSKKDFDNKKRTIKIPSVFIAIFAIPLHFFHPTKSPIILSHPIFLITPYIFISLGFKFFIILLVAVVVFGFKSFVVIPQQEVHVVERLGRFHRALTAGLNILIPFIDRVAYRHSLKEIPLDVPSQVCITRDNTQLTVDGIIYFQVTDPKLASYGSSNYIMAITQLAQTTLRSVIGRMELDKTFEERDEINSTVVSALDEAAGAWGVKVLRYEIKDLVPPQEILRSMQAQITAEREKRARIAESEGRKIEQINLASGQREAEIQQSEGEAQAAVNASNAEKIARINRAKGEAESLRLVAEANAEAIRQIAAALQTQGGADAVNLKIAEQYVAAFNNLAKESNTLIMPANVADIGSLISAGMKILDKGKTSQ